MAISSYLLHLLVDFFLKHELVVDRVNIFLAFFTDFRRFELLCHSLTVLTVFVQVELSFEQIIVIQILQLVVDVVSARSSLGLSFFQLVLQHLISLLQLF